MSELRTVTDLKPGDLIDLQGDLFADPRSESTYFACEYATVDLVEDERELGYPRVAVWVLGVDCFGFPPDHKVKFFRGQDVS